MIISNTNKGIYFAWRDENNERKSEVVPFSDYPPYFYIEENAFQPDKIVKMIDGRIVKYILLDMKKVIGLI